MQFEPIEQWIWFPSDSYPEHIRTAQSVFQGKKDTDYTVVKIEKEFHLSKPIASVHIRTSGDTFFRLHVNGEHCATGPASVGGDFLSNERIRPQHYATELTLSERFPGFAEGRILFSAIVRTMPLHMFEYSQSYGGFFLTAHVRFADGTKTVLLTDETWRMTLLQTGSEPQRYDSSMVSANSVQAQRIPNVWHCLTSPLPSCTEVKIVPEGGEAICVPAGGSIEMTLSMDMIYTGYLDVAAHTQGILEADIRCYETSETGSTESYRFHRDGRWTGTRLHSARFLQITASNTGESDACLTVTFLASHYPVTEEAKTVTSDPELNAVLRVCSHTLRYCRQTLHLDSGSHCEPLACTGDYYIEALMTAYTFGDQRLSAFDVRRTAQLLRYNNGRMFHTTYSLIWVQMLWDVYRFTGERDLLADCEDALILLMERFAAYIGENGLIENPPDYMFVDWLIPDGISTHHPPKALGQTCLNLFYYGALRTACHIYTELGEESMAAKMDAAADAIQPIICDLLYDREKGLFFEGLNTPTPEHLLYCYMPQNVEKRYYRKHANILAAYFGILDKEGCRALIEKIMTDPSLGEVQPYFTHFLLEAVYRNGLREKYTRMILEDWKEPVRTCPYGLAEGFHKPEPTYSFDHSHAWGGTPCWSLPLALTGMELLEPGYRRVRFCPSLLGLEYAEVQIPTPYGRMEVKLEKGKEPVFAVPDGITVEA
ncbi:MAG: hypothetical protein E7658_10305 [Ruminococcaceae bacterium]|nr:hypothetical protein [Oscillospiraceae bacterium]